MKKPSSQNGSGEDEAALAPRRLDLSSALESSNDVLVPLPTPSARSASRTGPETIAGCMVDFVDTRRKPGDYYSVKGVNYKILAILEFSVPRKIPDMKCSAGTRCIRQHKVQVRRLTPVAGRPQGSSSAQNPLLAGGMVHSAAIAGTASEWLSVSSAAHRNSENSVNQLGGSQASADSADGDWTLLKTEEQQSAANEAQQAAVAEAHWKEGSCLDLAQLEGYVTGPKRDRRAAQQSWGLSHRAILAIYDKLLLEAADVKAEPGVKAEPAVERERASWPCIGNCNPPSLVQQEGGLCPPCLQEALTPAEDDTGGGAPDVAPAHTRTFVFPPGMEPAVTAPPPPTPDQLIQGSEAGGLFLGLSNFRSSTGQPTTPPRRGSASSNGVPCTAAQAADCTGYGELPSSVCIPCQEDLHNSSTLMNQVNLQNGGPSPVMQQAADLDDQIMAQALNVGSFGQGVPVGPSPQFQAAQMMVPPQKGHGKWGRRWGHGKRAKATARGSGTGRTAPGGRSRHHRLSSPARSARSCSAATLPETIAAGATTGASGPTGFSLRWIRSPSSPARPCSSASASPGPASAGTSSWENTSDGPLSRGQEEEGKGRTIVVLLL